MQNSLISEFSRKIWNQQCPKLEWICHLITMHNIAWLKFMLINTWQKYKAMFGKTYKELNANKQPGKLATRWPQIGGLNPITLLLKQNYIVYSARKKQSLNIYVKYRAAFYKWSYGKETYSVKLKLLNTQFRLFQIGLTCIFTIYWYYCKSICSW